MGNEKGSKITNAVNAENLSVHIYSHAELFAFASKSVYDVHTTPNHLVLPDIAVTLRNLGCELVRNECLDVMSKLNDS
jgi:hypothetical protein